MRITIVGRNLPTRSIRGEDGVPRADVHVGVQDGREPVGLVPVTAASARWEVEVRTVVADSGADEFRGTAVHGRKGERFLYLTWGDLGDDGGFTMFRRAKLVLDRIDPEVRAAAVADQRLACEVDLTGSDGGPVCARVDPPAIRWWVPDGPDGSAAPGQDHQAGPADR